MIPQNFKCKTCLTKFPFTKEFFNLRKKYKHGLTTICTNCINEYLKNYGQKYRDNLKYEVLLHYSKGEIKCNCCNIKDIDVLTLDHIYGKGKIHRKNNGKSHFYFQ